MTTEGVSIQSLPGAEGMKRSTALFVDKATKRYVSVSCETFADRDYGSTG
jgi:hypothetical protein